MLLLAPPLLLAATLLINTLRYGSTQLAVEPAAAIAIEQAAIAEHLAQAVRFRTISHGDDTPVDEQAFRGLHDYLSVRFPRSLRPAQRDRRRA